MHYKSNDNKETYRKTIYAMIEENKLYHRDCFHLMQDIPDKSINMILSDPPYACLNKNNKDAGWDKEIDLQEL